MSKYILATLATAGLVAGHGYVTNGTIGGVSYEFYQPYTDVSDENLVLSWCEGIYQRSGVLTLSSLTPRPLPSVSLVLSRVTAQ